MTKVTSVRLGALLLIVLAAGVFGTTLRAMNQDPVKLNLSIEPQSIRFSTPGKDVLDWRLEVVNQQDQTIFDSQFTSGNDLAWSLVDSQGQSVESGVYDYTLTIRGHGPLRTRRGQLLVQKTSKGYDVWPVSDQQSALAANGETTVIVTGATNTTVETNAAPGGSAPSGLSNSTAANTAGSAPTASVAIVPLISGSGTTGSMTKWLDGPSGVVGDTNVTEQNGSVVVGNGTFRGNVQIFGGALDDVFAGMGPDLINGPGFNYGYAGSSFGRSAGFFNVRPDASASAPNPSLRFMTANVQRMIITNAGNTGIGTTSPAGKLEVLGENATVAFVTNYGFDAPYVIGRRAGGTIAAPSAVLSGDRLFLIGARGYVAGGFNNTSSARIEMHSTEDWTNSASGADIRFYTVPNGSNAISERMRINHDGNVGIGTIAALAERLHVAGDIRVGSSGTNGCLQRFDAVALVGTCVSDLRFKRDITPFPNVLDQMVKLRPVHYFWRSSEFPERQFGPTQAYGLIAQEVEQILPELVQTDEQSYKRVDYSKLPLLALQAIKELKAENDALKQQLQQQDERLRRLEAAARNEARQQ